MTTKARPYTLQQAHDLLDRLPHDTDTLRRDLSEQITRERMALATGADDYMAQLATTCAYAFEHGRLGYLLVDARRVLTDLLAEVDA